MRIHRRYRPRWSSLLFVGVTAFLGIGAIQSSPNLLPLVFGVALTVVLISGIVGGGMMMGLRPRRHRVGPAQVGLPWRVRYEVRSRARFVPSFALQIAERPTKGNAGWERHFAREGGAGRAFVAQIGPRERVHAIGKLMPTRRGVCEFEGVEVASAFPFGLFHKSIGVDQPVRVIVRPRVSPLRAGALPDLISAAGHEAPTSRAHRTGDEFFALREYTPGDSPRFIAWRTSARLGSLVVREHTERTTKRTRLVILVSPSASEEDAERAIELGASIASSLAQDQSSVRVEIPQAGFDMNDARPGTIGRVLDALAMLDPEHPAPDTLQPTKDATLLVRTDEMTDLPAPPAHALVLTSSDLGRIAHAPEALV